MSSNGGGAWACKVYGCVSRRSLVGFVILAGLAVQLSPTRSWWAVGDRKLQKHAEGPRVAICFFGLTRSLQWTLPSIKNRLIDVLRDHELTVDVFVHTYELEKVSANESTRFDKAYVVLAKDEVIGKYRTHPVAPEVLRRFYDGPMVQLAPFANVSLRLSQRPGSASTSLNHEL